MNRFLTENIVSAWGGPNQRSDFADRLTGLSREGVAEEIADYLHEKDIETPGLQEEAEMYFGAMTPQEDDHV